MTIAHALLGFAVVAGLLTLIPGLDTAIVLRKAVSGSRRQAFAAAAGIQLGTIVWGVAAAAGVTALLAVSALAYRVVSLAGAGYLVVMGVVLLAKSFRAHPADEAADEAADDAAEAAGTASALRRSDGVLRSLAAGLVTNLLNPKVGVFYLATIPQFLPSGVSALLMGLLLALVHCALGAIWLSLVTVGGHRLSARLRSNRFVRWVDRIIGGVLVLFGAKLAVSSR